jgi:NAD(P)-dependent dehydrogenase (short-subunit alcohol dehydrogenase family)
MRPQPIALVTGGNRGIGLEVCRQLAENRLRVLLGARDAAKGAAAAREMSRGGFEVEAVELDVADAASIRALGAELSAVDVLINNAGADYDTDQTAISADLAGSGRPSRPMSSAPGRWLRRWRPACAGAAGAASSMSAAALAP